MHELIKAAYQEREPLLAETATLLEQEVRAALQDVEHIDRISCRAKSSKSFLEKAFDPANEPGYTDPLREIEDQVAGRVIVFFLGDIPTVREKLRKAFTPVEYRKRRPARDEEFGYESEHLICIVPPQVKTPGWLKCDDMPNTFELQIRTIFMHAYAEPQHDTAYKSSSDLPSHIRRELAWIAAASWGADQAYERFALWRKENPQSVNSHPAA
jgi:ppGpp synthetase/RelA/SpoT-type nucleotidyltranferase